MKRILICLVLAALPLRLPAGDFAGPEGLVGRRVPWLKGRVRFERLDGASAGAFEPVSYTHLDVYKRQAFPS